MSGQEIFVIIIVILVLFGADKLPEIARTVSRGMRDFRKATDDIRREFEESTSEFRKDLNDVTSSITSDITEISGNIKKDADEVAENLARDINEFKDSLNEDINEVKENLESDLNTDSIPPVDDAWQSHDFNQAEDEGITGEGEQGDTGDPPSTYKRTINEPDDNYYNYRD